MFSLLQMLSAQNAGTAKHISGAFRREPAMKLKPASSGAQNAGTPGENTTNTI